MCLFRLQNMFRNFLYWIKYYLDNFHVFSDRIKVVLMSLLFILSRFHTLLWFFHYWLWTSKCQLAWFKEVFGVIQKITIDNLYKQPFSLYHNYFIFDFLLKYWNVGQERGKLQNLDLLMTKKSILNEIKSIAHVFFKSYIVLNMKK